MSSRPTLPIQLVSLDVLRVWQARAHDAEARVRELLAENAALRASFTSTIAEVRAATERPASSNELALARATDSILADVGS